MRSYKKGHIIPRRLIRASLSSAQHLVKFGCDVEVEGTTITAKTSGTVVYIRNLRGYLGGKNGKPRRYFSMAMKGITVVGAGNGDSTFIDMGLDYEAEKKKAKSND